MPKTVIVSAANSPYVPMLKELISSIRGTPVGAEIPIGILDVGLTEADRAELEKSVQHLVSPPWDYDFPKRETAPTHFRAMTARPSLPKYFPGYEMIVWIDADAWIQKWSAVEDFIKAAASGRLAVVQEHDRSYMNVYNITNSRKLFYDSLRYSFGEECAKALGQFPMINSGAFAMRADCPVWMRWRDLLGRGLQTYSSHLSEQTALNVAAYESQRNLYPLPATHNWVCLQSLPAFDPVKRLYVEPLIPHAELGIVHQTGWKRIRAAGAVLKDIQGNITSLDLSYSQWRQQASP